MSKYSKVNLEDAIAFSIRCHAWTNTGKGDVEKVETDAKKNRLGVYKELVSSPEYDAIVKFIERTRSNALNRCMPSPLVIAGGGLMRPELQAEVELELQQAQLKLRDQLVPALVAIMPQLKQNAKEELGSQYNERDYPSDIQLARKFRLEWNFVDYKSLVMGAMRERTLSLVIGIIDKLKVNKKGKRPILRKSAFNEAKAYLAAFDQRNLMNDEELEKLVTSLQGFVNANDVDYLRSNETVRDDAAKQLEGVSDSLKVLLAKSSRKVVFDKENE